MACYSPIQTLTLNSFLWELKCAEFEWNDKELISLVVSIIFSFKTEAEVFIPCRKTEEGAVQDDSF